jgi:hypothetical protein
MNMPARRRIPYSAELGEWIADRIAEGTSVAQLCEAYPDSLPSVATIRAWRDALPAFNALMVAADRALADTLAHATIGIADGPRQAARARNAIQARQWMAERLDRERFGARVDVAHSGRATIEHIHTLSEAALVAIIQRAEAERGRTLEHEPAERATLPAPGHPPAAREGPSVASGGEGPRLSSEKSP